ncbi:hypothetical protein PsWM33_04578 [Pseudovibrio sp. WM33]|nr:hypothetical protein PsWM33_04578 [Pseudovibrio sp. WM33]
MLKRRNVKSEPSHAADAHEHGRDYLNSEEIDLLLAAAKNGRHGGLDHLLIIMWPSRF